MTTGITRMELISGINAEDINYCAGDVWPCSFEDADTCSSGDNCLFAPEGGGVSAIGQCDTCKWQFMNAMSFSDIGTGAADMVMLQTFSEDLCRIYNESVGRPATPLVMGDTGGGHEKGCYTAMGNFRIYVILAAL